MSKDGTTRQDESRLTAASYIISFYNEVQTINHNYADYLNYSLELENKYGSGGDFSKAADEEKHTISMLLQLVRRSAHKTYIQYNCIDEALPKPKGEKSISIEKEYEKIKSTYVILRADLEEYVIKLNKILVSRIMAELLTTSSQIIESVYGGEGGA